MTDFRKAIFLKRIFGYAMIKKEKMSESKKAGGYHVITIYIRKFWGGKIFYIA